MEARFAVLSLHYFIVCLLVKHSLGACDQIKAKVSQKLLKQGFHRDIEYVVSLNELNIHDIWSNGACRINIKQVLPAGAYVSPDEMQELKRHNRLHASPVGDVDVEKPKHMSRNTVVHIFSPINSPRMKFVLPIHLRYHRAKSKGGYDRLRIRRPWILLRCPNNIFKMCNSAETIIAPCAEFSPLDCSWHNISTSTITPYLETTLPVGNLDDRDFIVMVTLFVSFASCFLIIFSQNKIDSSNKNIPNKKHKTT